MCVFKLLFAVHAVLSKAFGKGIGVDLQFCDLKTTTKTVLHLVTFPSALVDLQLITKSLIASQCVKNL